MGRPANYSAGVRLAAAAMVREIGKSIAEVARDLGLDNGTFGMGQHRSIGGGVVSSGRTRGASGVDEVARFHFRREGARLEEPGCQLLEVSRSGYYTWAKDRRRSGRSPTGAD